MPTKARIEKVKRVLSSRQPDLRVVMEEVTNAHNASAVVRTCDAAGILYVDIISSTDEPFPVNEAISTRAEKWLEFCYHKTTEECFSHLKDSGFKIAATSLEERAMLHTDVDYTQPVAVVFGNESEGISQAALGLADYVIRIPMAGMVQSLNLSVSVAIILYEALKQRKEKGYSSSLSEEEYNHFLKKWLGLSKRGVR